MVWELSSSLPGPCAHGKQWWQVCIFASTWIPPVALPLRTKTWSCSNFCEKRIYFWVFNEYSLEHHDDDLLQSILKLLIIIICNIIFSTIHHNSVSIAKFSNDSSSITFSDSLMQKLLSFASAFTNDIIKLIEKILGIAMHRIHHFEQTFQKHTLLEYATAWEYITSKIVMTFYEKDLKWEELTCEWKKLVSSQLTQLTFGCGIAMWDEFNYVLSPNNT